jgi:hypothetical protein
MRKDLYVDSFTAQPCILSVAALAALALQP